MKTSILTVAIAAAFLFSSCSSASKIDSESASIAAAVSENFVFNGKDLNAWKGFRTNEIPNSWRVHEGAIHFNPVKDASGKITSERGDIITAAQYDDFELSLDWKIAKCGNSGIFFNVVESDRYTQTYHTGPEMQVLDNTCHPDAENGMDRYAGANYALHSPSVDNTKAAGEWNSARLRVEGNTVQHWLNGEKVVEYELNSSDWKKKVAASKFARMPGYATGGFGHIALQDHGDPVWFRNIKITVL